MYPAVAVAVAAAAAAAAAFLWSQIGLYPSLAPLVLVLKVYLRSCGLNEVANGGISCFALTNMVLAHIMDELRVSMNLGVKHQSQAGCIADVSMHAAVCRNCIAAPTQHSCLASISCAAAAADLLLLLLLLMTGRQ